MDLTIRDERPTDCGGIFRVNREAFGRDAEAKLVDAVRAGGYCRVSLVAEVDGQVVGHVLFSQLPIRTQAGVVGSLSLAPMAVIPGWQRKGIGSALVREGLRVARERSHESVVVLGHAEFYPRFGFSAAIAKRLASPFPDAGAHWMASELVPGALAGVSGNVEYPPPFFATG